MKAILLSTILLCFCSPADEDSNGSSSVETKQENLKVEALHLDIHLVVLPATSRISNGEEVDLDVYVINDSLQPIDCPSSTDLNQDGYSDASVNFHPNYFRFQGMELERFGGGQDSNLLMDRKPSRLDRRKSKHYKFKWKCSSEHFDVITLDVEFFIAGKHRRGTATFLPKRQPDSTGQPATRAESKSEGSNKNQPEAEGRSR